MLCSACDRARVCSGAAQAAVYCLVSCCLSGVSDDRSASSRDAVWSIDMTTIAPVGGVMASGITSVSVGAVEPGAAAQQSFQDALRPPVTTLQMEPAQAADQLGSKVMEWMETSYERVQRNAVPELSVTPAPAASGTGFPNNAGAAQAAEKPDAGRQAMQMLEHAFSFAIEATLMSKISTESTRIFNTFLKGQ